MIWSTLQLIGFLIFVLLSTRSVIKRKFDDLVSLYFWATTFNSCFFYAVTIWHPTKIIQLAMGASIMLYARKRDLPPKVKTIAMFSSFILILSDLASFITPPEYNANVLNPTTRLMMGNLNIILALFLAYYCKMIPHGSCAKILKHYYLAVEVAIGFGLIHYVCNKVGIEFMPIMREGYVTEGSSVLAEVGGVIVQRVYGVSGEPKNLAFIIVPYAVLSVVSYLRGEINRSKKYHLGFLVAGFFVILNTYSSSAFIEIALAIPFVMSIARIRMSPTVVIAAFLLFIGSFIYSGLQDGGSSDPNSLSAIYDRSFGRGQKELEEGRQEVDIVDAYLDANVFNQIFGWGTYQYTFHAKDQLTIYGGLKPVQSGVVVALADFGIMGIIAYILVFMAYMFVVKRSRADSSSNAFKFAVMGLCSMIGSLMYGTYIGSFIFLIVSYAAYEDDIRNKCNYIR